MTTPYYITDLVAEKVVKLQFTAPPEAGKCTYQVCIQSDSYLGLTQTSDIHIDVKSQTKYTDGHSQWDITSSEESDSDDSNSSSYVWTDNTASADSGSDSTDDFDSDNGSSGFKRYSEA